MKKASLVVATLACVAVWAGPAAAQAITGTPVVRSDTRGLGIGLQLNRTGMDQGRGDGLKVLGAGAALSVSYGVSDAVSLFARGGTGYRSSYMDLGARYRFGGATSALRPYVEAAATVVGATRTVSDAFEAPETLRSRGLAATVGAGVEYYVSPRLALDLGVTFSGGRFEENPATGLNDGFVSNRVQMGITFRP